MKKTKESLERIIEKINKKEVVVLESKLDRNGEETAVINTWYGSNDDEYILHEVMCYDSSLYQLGNCACGSHTPNRYTKFDSKKDLVEKIKEILEMDSEKSNKTPELSIGDLLPQIF